MRVTGVRRLALGLAAATGTALVLGACVNDPPVTTFTATPTTASDVVLSSEPSPQGRILATAQGYTLYMFAPDTPARSDCVSATCTQLWPPLVVQGKVSTGTPYGRDVRRSLVGEIQRPDGSTQLTYAGHPLYTWNSDTSPGLITGQAVDNEGGDWYVVSVSGAVIKKAFAVEN